MKKILHALLLSSIVCGIISCSNGDYNADPSSNANAAVNPITPLTDQEFTWSGEEPMSADINGSHWTADHAYFSLDTSGANVIIGIKDNSPIQLRFYLQDVWKGNVYDMEWHNYKRYAIYTDSTSVLFGPYYSYLSNSGGLQILQNDTAVIKGMFYFKGVTANGKTVTVNKGFFKIDKP